MGEIRAVVFDLGHTIWNFSPRAHVRRFVALQMHQHLLERTGADAPLPAVLDRSFITTIQRWMSVWDSDDLVQPPTTELVREATVHAGAALSETEIAELTLLAFGREHDVPIVEPDTLAALSELEQQGIAMGCVTNTILLDEAIDDLLSRLGLRRHFRAAVVSSSTDFRKPHESLFRRATEELGVEPHDALFVGDRLVDDISGAKSIGMRAVLTHQYRQEDVSNAPVAPDGVVSRIAELPRLIRQLQSRQ